MSFTAAEIRVSLKANGRGKNTKSKEKNVLDATLVNTVAYDGAPTVYHSLGPRPTQDGRKPPERDSTPTRIFLPSHPSEQELANIIAATKGGFALTGSAAMGHVGPILGLMDVGECENSYMFRMALPGVKKENNEFSLCVDNTGKVSIRGVTTTGEKLVHRFSHVFEMKTQNLCSSGPFSVSFQLPGRVVAEELSGNLTDGILEVTVMKEKSTTPTSQP
ncbi:hypothetical protein ACOSQ4_015118 [Xanthoceras sorbifolium]